MAEPGEGTRRGARVAAAAALLAASVLLSRVLGYVREAVLAAQIGVSGETDAYRAAFQIPDLLNYFLAGGALSIAFVPFYTRVRGEEGDAAAARLLATVFGTLAALALLATAALWWWADALVALQFPRFDPAKRELTAHLTRIVLPAQIFFVTGGVVRAALMAHGRFRTQALAPLLYNAGIIAGGLAFGGRYGAEGFAWGALGGAALGALAVPLLDVRAAGLRVGFRIAPLDAAFLRYAVVALPLMVGVSLLTVDEWYDRWFGGLLAEGTVAILGYARILMQIPVAVVGQAVATAALPTLAALHARGEGAERDRLLVDTLRASLGMAIVCAAGAFVFADPLATLVYQRGAFTAADTAAVADLLRVFAFAVPGWVTQQIAVRAFYARTDMWRPMLLGTAVAVAAIPLYLLAGPRYGAAGLAAAGAFGMTANAVLTLALARRLHGAPAAGPLLSTALRAAGIAAAAGVAGGLSMPGRPGSLGAFLDLGVGGGVFAIALVAGVWSLGDASLRAPLERFARRVRGARESPRDPV